jgi:alpha-amylase/alpha-mannosidase (GH57 family)
MKKVHLAFLWHQHQPVYKNPANGVYELPWVRLHATKDYYDTAAILDEFPKIKSNFNLVPSLLIQLEEYAQRKASDYFLDLTLKKAENLTEDEKVFLLKNFFMANWETMVCPQPRYLQLLDKRGRQVNPQELKRIQAYFNPQDFRDLQMWFNLAWMDPYWREKDTLVKSLFTKGKNFSEEDIRALVDKQLEICGLVCAKYKALQESGQIEISTTPFYHPILPLLCDTNNALGSSPHMPLPAKRFAHREDAKYQVEKASEYYNDTFGHKPAGMWPAEGSVSEDVIPIFAQAGVKWIASDEGILFRTNPLLLSSRRNLYKPYKLEILGSSINMIFRDHALSDSIGFVYSKWNAKDAVNDFMRKVHSIRDMSDDGQQCIISVILDGENCWEYYPNDGWDFLRLLYKTISEDPTVETVTINNYLENNPPVDTLRTIWPGSWINSNYEVWIGHPEDNLAWSYLAEARDFLMEYTIKHPEKQDSNALKSAWQSVYIAEGSDWNWWYGEDHASDNDEIFDFLFRQYVISVYTLVGEKAPNHLYKAIKGMAVKPQNIEPIDFITPKIDGKVSSYFEWQAAGFYSTSGGGAMHQVETVLKSFHYGFDINNLYFRLDLNIPLNEQSINDLSFNVVFLQPQGIEASLSIDSATKKSCFCLKNTLQVSEEMLDTAAIYNIIELAVPINRLKLENNQNTIEFIITILNKGHEIERWPYRSTITIPKPAENFTIINWSAI